MRLMNFEMKMMTMRLFEYSILHEMNVVFLNVCLHSKSKITHSNTHIDRNKRQ